MRVTDELPDDIVPTPHEARLIFAIGGLTSISRGLDANAVAEVSSTPGTQATTVATGFVATLVDVRDGLGQRPDWRTLVAG